MTWEKMGKTVSFLLIAQKTCFTGLHPQISFSALRVKDIMVIYLFTNGPCRKRIRPILPTEKVSRLYFYLLRIYENTAQHLLGFVVAIYQFFNQRNQKVPIYL